MSERKCVRAIQFIFRLSDRNSFISPSTNRCGINWTLWTLFIIANHAHIRTYWIFAKISRMRRKRWKRAFSFRNYIRNLIFRISMKMTAEFLVLNTTFQLVRTQNDLFDLFILYSQTYFNCYINNKLEKKTSRIDRTKFMNMHHSSYRTRLYKLKSI